MSKIRILVVEPSREPKEIKVEHTLENLQKLVDGLIEYVELDCNTDIICNEEGKLLGLELNRKLGNDIIAGTFLIVGHHNEETISLSRKQIKKYKEIFRLAHNKEIEYFKSKLKKSNCIVI